MSRATFSSLKPQQIWKNFASICAIPHPSQHEEKLALFIKDFGNKLGLETHIYEWNNVIIKKAATKDMENCKTVILQSHLDMVPQKNDNIKHDFINDPIEIYVDGEYITAKDTTLGADNGLGVATIMAILEADDIQHGPIEALFTTNEEAGMDGAANIKSSSLSGTILLNLDTELEGEIDIGCAGGIQTNIVMPFSPKPVTKNFSYLKVSVTNLKGGHSGTDIILQRGNANKILNRFLLQTANNYELRLTSLNGGTVANAIPREAFATIAIPNSLENKFNNCLNDFTNIIKQEFTKTDPNIQITAEKIAPTAITFSKEFQTRLLKAIYGCPNGVIGMSHDIPNLVETSSNLAIIKTTNDKILITTSQRSSIESRKQQIATMVASIFELAGGKTEHANSYPAWQPNTNSEILQIAAKVYKDKFSKDPDIKIIHAGLECALFRKTFPELDMISFGPTIDFPHSPDEKIYIPSVANFWDFLLEILRNIPTTP